MIVKFRPSGVPLFFVQFNQLLLVAVYVFEVFLDFFQTQRVLFSNTLQIFRELFEEALHACLSGDGTVMTGDEVFFGRLISLRVELDCHNFLLHLGEEFFPIVGREVELSRDISLHSGSENRLTKLFQCLLWISSKYRACQLTSSCKGVVVIPLCANDVFVDWLNFNTIFGSLLGFWEVSFIHTWCKEIINVEGFRLGCSLISLAFRIVHCAGT